MYMPRLGTHAPEGPEERSEWELLSEKEKEDEMEAKKNAETAREQRRRDHDEALAILKKENFSDADRKTFLNRIGFFPNESHVMFTNAWVVNLLNTGQDAPKESDSDGATNLKDLNGLTSFQGHIFTEFRNGSVEKMKMKLLKTIKAMHPQYEKLHLNNSTSFAYFLKCHETQLTCCMWRDHERGGNQGYSNINVFRFLTNRCGLSRESCYKYEDSNLWVRFVMDIAMNTRDEIDGSFADNVRTQARKVLFPCMKTWLESIQNSITVEWCVRNLTSKFFPSNGVDQELSRDQLTARQKKRHAALMGMIDKFKSSGADSAQLIGWYSGLKEGAKIDLQKWCQQQKIEWVVETMDTDGDEMPSNSLGKNVYCCRCTVAGRG